MTDPLAKRIVMRLFFFCAAALGGLLGGLTPSVRISVKSARLWAARTVPSMPWSTIRTKSCGSPRAAARPAERARRHTDFTSANLTLTPGFP